MRSCTSCSSPTEGARDAAAGSSELWYGGSAGAPLLAPLAWIYAAITGARRRAYASGVLRQRRLARPVVVVGNLTVGGTGKTPLAIWLACMLRGEELRVGIVSRGYGRRAAGATRRASGLGLA